jgi:hypothetical protein
MPAASLVFSHMRGARVLKPLVRFRDPLQAVAFLRNHQSCRDWPRPSADAAVPYRLFISTYIFFMPDTLTPPPELLTIDLDQAEPPHVASTDEYFAQRSAASQLPIVE